MGTDVITRRTFGAGLGGLTLSGAATARAAEPAGRQTYYMFVFNSPKAGREAEYNRYYDEVHVPQVLAVPGFVSAQRMVYNDEVQLKAAALKKPRYLVMYTIVTDNLAGVIAENQRRARDGLITPSDTYDRAGSLNYLYRAVGTRVHGRTPQPAKAQPGPMRTYFHIVFGDPLPGQEEAFNTWYEEVHNPELGNSPGWVLAKRGVYSELQYRPNVEPTKYVAIFSAVTSDLPATIEARVRDPKRPPVFSDPARTFGYTYRALGPAVHAKA